MSVYRCQGCREHLRGPPYKRIGLGAVCSPACAADIMSRTPKTTEGRSQPRSEISLTTRAVVLQRDNYRCRYCGGRQDLHAHHIDYRSQGGGHDEINLVMLCRDHHALVHTAKRHWQPILRAYIWMVYVEGRPRWLRDLEKEIDGEKTPNM